ncbi:hypothetical protein BH09ACT5_BH09ACT5_15520 [soil metagenome]
MVGGRIHREHRVADGETLAEASVAVLIEGDS